MKLLALTEAPNHVCYRYRIEAFAEALALRGWSLQATPLASGTFQRSGQLRGAADFDVTILQRRLLPLWQVRLLRKHARFLIYDIDDALFYRDSFNRKGPASWTRLAHFWATIYAADAVFAGNEYLRQQAAVYIDPSRVFYMPTCVDLRRYELALHRRRWAGVRLAWIGQSSTLSCLQLAQPQLAAASRAVAGLELHVICNTFPDLDDVKVVPHVWTSATEALDLAEADIGISYLPDDPWSMGKCGLKVLQYMAAGLPVVANRVGMNREMVIHGETGFLAETPAQWAEALSRLAADPGLRQRMGMAGREHVRHQYSLDRWAGEFAQRIDQLPKSAPRVAGDELPLGLRGEPLVAASVETGEPDLDDTAMAHLAMADLAAPNRAIPEIKVPDLAVSKISVPDAALPNLAGHLAAWERRS